MEKTYKLEQYLKSIDILEYGILNKRVENVNLSELPRPLGRGIGLVPAARPRGIKPVHSASFAKYKSKAFVFGSLLRENKVLSPFLSKNLACIDYKSLIIIAYPYSTNILRKQGLYGDISMSQAGQDYHIVVKEMLNKISDFIKNNYDGDCACFVDISPFCEKELAHIAGVGGFSKNTTIITKRYGSRVNLGVIATNVDFAPKKNVQENYCKGCNKCVTACPTYALDGQYTMKHIRCLSYITQHKKDIPIDLFQKMNKTVFGCDICQSVCPYNKKQGEQVDLFTQIDIEQLFALSNSEFKKLYDNSAFFWRGKNILLRNSIIALSNMTDEKSYLLLEKAAGDSRDFVRHYIAMALKRR